MKKLKLEILCFSLSLLLLFLSCFALSRYADGQIHAVKEKLDVLPSSARIVSDAEARAEAIDAARQIEAQLKKAEESLAFFVSYDHINKACACASNFSAALSGDERSDIESARRALAEALDSLLRLNEFSLEIFL